MSKQAEFSRPVRIDTLGTEPRKLEIEANEAEASALARRFALPAVHRLSAEALLTARGEIVLAEGRLRASVVQSCVATSAPVDAELDEPFRIEFRPEPDAAAPEEEIELTESEMDVVFYDGASIDLGEAVAETLSLSLDPWPRVPGAERILREAGVKAEEEGKAEASPFAALAGLKDKLSK
jgi:uncharacterized metal-binding protein YceD (DUF177 family)